MPGVRLNGFLASSAVALLLSTSAFAQTATPADAGSAAAAPDSTKPVAAAPSAPDKANAPAASAAAPVSAAPADTASTAAPASAAPPSATPAETATAPQPASPDASATSPATANSSEPTAAPQPPAAAASPDTTSTPAHADNTTPAAAPDTTGTAETPAAATPAAASVTPPAPPTIADQVADQLRQLSSGKFDRILGGKAERASIEAFYSGRSYAPIWITDAHANDRAIAAIGYLAHVGADGLNPADYPVPNFKSATDPQTLAEDELKFDVSVVTYAKHASIGRVAWSRVDANIEYDTKAPDPASVLASMADAKDVASALDGYEPHAPQYEALKKKLAELRGGDSNGLKPPIPNGPALRIGEQDARVPALREKLGVTGDGNTYDKALAEAVKAFQKEHGLRQTGTLTAPTVEALNGPRPTHVIDTILANMERWRWMPHDLGTNYAMINLPDFTAHVFHDGKQIWQTKIVIGMPNKPTPIMSTLMRFITVNPVWHVPPSIINNEYLPAMAQDPTVMQRMGLVVERDASGRVTGIYQPPGDNSAEGRIRFNFPNKFLVFQHDTPDKYMFKDARRAFSHGCMRTQFPAHYAAVLLSLVRPDDGYTVERLHKMYGPHEINIEFPKPLPIHITYQTAFVDAAGKLEFRDDIYGRDRELLAILHTPQEMRIADIPVEHSIPAGQREILQAADNMPTRGGWGGAGGSSGGPVGFFQQLFSGFGSPTPPPPRPVGRHRVSRTYPYQRRYSAE
jgi:murein L,D-transpeptidase YcbB/YkuD